MATLITNKTNVPECDPENKAAIDDRVDELNTNAFKIRDEIMDYHYTVAASINDKVKKLKKATSFPVKDIQRMLTNNPDCEYLRVYNGFDSNGEYVTYMAPISATFEFYNNEQADKATVISKSCCQCKPCRQDKLLNP